MQQSSKPNRLLSLDTLRGMDMLLIMGGGAFFKALAILIPLPFFQEIAAQMVHQEWDGLTVYDMIFPLFIFIAGISFPFSYENQRARGLATSSIYKKIIKRGLTLVVLGVIYNGFLKHWDFETQRYLSVLGRIGLSWMFAAMIFVAFSLRSRIIIAVSLLVGYYLLLACFVAPDANGASNFSLEGNIASYIDRMIVPGTLRGGNHDALGLVSTLPAIVTAMLGMFVGEWLKFAKEGLTEKRRVAYLIAAGAILIVVGLLWSIVFPINKNLWSSSFVCCVGGISICLFSIFYYVVDVMKYQRWTLFFRVIGMNSILIYMGQQVINFSHTSKYLFSGVINMLPDTAQPLALATGYIAVCWIFLYLLYRKGVFLKV